MFDNVGRIIRQYKKENKLVAEQDNEGNYLENIALKYELFSYQIEFIGALLNCSKLEMCFKSIINVGITSEIMTIMADSLTDPKLLRAVVYLTNQVLAHPAMDPETKE